MHIHSILGAGFLICMANPVTAQGDPSAAVAPSRSVTVDKGGTITTNGLMVQTSGLLSIEARSQVGQRLAQS